MGARIINRQRVVNQWGSPHIDLSPWEFGSPEDDPSYPKPRHYDEEVQEINEEIDRIASSTRGSTHDLKKLAALYKERAAVTEESMRGMRNPSRFVVVDPEMKWRTYPASTLAAAQKKALALSKKYFIGNVEIQEVVPGEPFNKFHSLVSANPAGSDFEFVPQRLIPELENLWHLSKTAVGTGRLAEMERIDWTVDEFHNAHPELSHEHIFRDLAALVSGH